MKVATYKVTGRAPGQAYAIYQDGVLKQLLCDFDLPAISAITGEEFPLRELDLLHSEVFTAKKLEPRSVADKVALFCLHYKQHKTVAYRAGKEEKANLKHVVVNEQLLKVYLTSASYPLTGTKSMADYVRHYNAIRDLAANGKTVKSGMPAVYDLSYEKLISEDVSKLQRYWAHLRGLGWKKENGVWKSPEQIN